MQIGFIRFISEATDVSFVKLNVIVYGPWHPAKTFKCAAR